MQNIDSIINEKCIICNHHDFCLVYWGKECKRQGGQRIPRLKRTNAKKKVNPPVQPIKVHKKKVNQPNSRVSEPIQTKRVIWAL